jgi:hypothetical protein
MKMLSFHISGFQIDMLVGADIENELHFYSGEMKLTDESFQTEQS